MRDDEERRRWMRAGERLAELDAARFDRVLALAESYLSVYANEDEDTLRARLRRASGQLN